MIKSAIIQDVAFYNVYYENEIKTAQKKIKKKLTNGWLIKSQNFIGVDKDCQLFVVYEKNNL